MAEESGEAQSSDDRNAAAFALGAALSVRGVEEEAREYLRKQSRLADLQIENLEKLDEYELSHLRWRRFNEQIRGGLQILGFLVGLLFLIGLCALLWSAHEARGLVVTSFRTPPDLAEKGLDGTTLAQRLLDKLNALVLVSNGFTVRKPDTVQGNWGDDSKVEIPNTGISISELNRSLRTWLGQETRITGEVWRTSSGISLSVRAGANPGVTLSGKEQDLDKLLDNAAEQMLSQTLPYNYGGLLESRDQIASSVSVMRRVALAGAASDRPWAYISLAGTEPSLGQTREAISDADRAIALAPKNPYSYAIRAFCFYYLGEFERTANDEKKALELYGIDGDYGILPEAAAATRGGTDLTLGEEIGDFSLAVFGAQEIAQSGYPSYLANVDLILAAMAARHHDLGLSRAISARHPAWDDALALKNAMNLGFYPPEFFRLADLGEWTRAAADLSTADRATERAQTLIHHAYVAPWLAYALAMSGRTREALALIATCPTESYLCLEMRGRLAGSPAGAEYWFRRANEAGPSIPFANTDWGAMLLRSGNYDGAIAKFSEAHHISPHFADPLEMWGEALIAKNRSDLALAKFEEVNRYAPNWGRLHLKWGEALLWSGKTDEGKKQFAIAATLDLSSSDKAVLARLGAKYAQRE